jgi:hypothetical protein
MKCEFIDPGNALFTVVNNFKDLLLEYLLEYLPQRKMFSKICSCPQNAPYISFDTYMKPTTYRK